MHTISVIIPCFNEEEALPVYYEAMTKVMEQMDMAEFELLFVDDGSTDRTLGILKSLNERDERCRYLSFSRNFGKEAAIYAGLGNAKGDYVAIMDVDLQDPPSLLPKMYGILENEEYDSVATKRSTRTGEPKIRSFLSESFYKFINRISKTEIVNGARDYRLMKPTTRRTRRSLNISGLRLPPVSRATTSTCSSKATTRCLMPTTPGMHQRAQAATMA